MSDIQRVAKNDPSVDSLPIAPENPHANEASPSIPHRIPGRGAGSRVTVGYFDREGVDQLRRTLTHVSESHQDPVLNALSSETLSVPTTGPFDLEKTLRVIMKKCVVILRHRRPSLSLVRRRDRAGIQSRELGVLFKDLHVVGLGAAASHQGTFGSFFNPRIILENFRTIRHPPLRDILTGFEGVIRPGEMLRA
jgi:ATP-binding cassette subfamily G (WHITE) protein 2 (SNQ2)